MDDKLRISIVINLISMGMGMYLDWLWNYDGQSLIFLWPFMLVTLVLTPVNVIWCLVFIVKAKEKVVIANMVWIFLAALSVAAFFFLAFAFFL